MPIRKIGTVGKVADIGKVRTANTLRTVLNRRAIAGVPGTEGEPGQRPLPASERPHGAAHSSAIAGFGYINSEASLLVTFTTGKTYKYWDVSREAYNGLRNAESKGRYFNKNIKGAYPYARVG